jgi:hypothetical protein
MFKTHLSKYCNPIKRGDIFEKLTVIEFVDYHDNRAYWLCECVCGRRLIVSNGALKRKRTTSCVYCKK